MADLTDAEAVNNAAGARGSTACCISRRWRWWASRSSHPERYYRTNVGGTLNLLEAMTAAGVDRLVFSSTCAVYGEPDEVPITETATPRPVNAYGASKLAVDHMIGDFCTAHGLGAVSLRYFNVAGASGGVARTTSPRRT